MSSWRDDDKRVITFDRRLAAFMIGLLVPALAWVAVALIQFIGLLRADGVL